MRLKKLWVCFGVAVSMVVMAGCSGTPKEAEPQSFTREIAQHSEQVGEGDIITKIIEERRNGVYSIRIQVIKDGNVSETVHHMENSNFSISIPVSAHIMVQSAKEAGATSDTNILVFTQKLELARDAMSKTDYVRALEAVNEALRIDNYNPQAHAMKGSIYYSMGRYDMARKSFNYVLKVDPENEEVKAFQEFMRSTSENPGKVNVEGQESQ